MNYVINSSNYISDVILKNSPLLHLNQQIKIPITVRKICLDFH